MYEDNYAQLIVPITFICRDSIEFVIVQLGIGLKG